MLDIRKFCEVHGVAYRDSGKAARRGWFQIQCPMCGTGGTHGGWYLGYSLDSGAFSCWRCGALDFLTVIGRLLHTQDENAVRREVRKLQRPGDIAKAEAVVRRRKIDPIPGVGELLPQHRRYLEQRKFDPDKLTNEWGVQGTGALSGKWSWRVIFPIVDADGQTVAFQGRSISDNSTMKYKLSDDEDCLIPRSSMLFGLDKALDEDVMIVEGVTGVCRLGAGSVATLGISWNPAQANRLRRFKRRFIIFDPEEQAQARAQKIAEHLALFPGETEIISGFLTDPGDFSDRRAAKLRRELGFGA